MSSGWAPMLDNLRLYLASFPGQRATSTWAGTTVAATPEESIAAVRDALGVAAAGEVITTQGIRGHLERTVERHFLVRVDEPVPGFLSFYSFGADDGCGVHLQGYLFSDGAPGYVEREQPHWQAWLDCVGADVVSSGVRSG
jgi:hypothetical protein